METERVVLEPAEVQQQPAGWRKLGEEIVSKYEDHLPLYRQEKINRERHRVNLTRQTMNGWIEQAATRLEPIYHQMQEHLAAGDYVQVDKTPLSTRRRPLFGSGREG